MVKYMEKCSNIVKLSFCWGQTPTSSSKVITGGALYRIFVYHVRRRGICLGAIYLRGMNKMLPIIT